MSKALQLINSLEILNSKERLSLEEINDLEKTLSSEEVVNYLEALKFDSKPETASADLLRKIVDIVLDKKSFREVRIPGGFIDFAVQENKVNPILIELKPAFDRSKDKKGITGIYYEKLVLPKFKEQVQKYLVSNDFLILTNLNEAFLFNRDAILEYKPFFKISFAELLRLFLDSENLWDTVRRLEDQYVKPELEKEFFEDLLKWFEQLKLIEFEEKNGFSKNELIVLLLNKIIFIKTLEDYGLIPYKFLSDEYFSKYEKWEIKGIQKILNNFFTEIEEWFWDYYDTELFKTKIWDYIVKTKSNLDKFERVFEKVLGVGKWEYTFGKGMVHYNYRKIDEDVFGKAYEMFIAASRKDSGIYYTHRLITQYMSEQLVKKLFEPKINEIIACFDEHDYDKAKVLLEDLYSLTICDTTSGSGSFLIKSFREIYLQYQRLASKLDWVNHIQNGLFEKPAHVADAEDFLKHALLDQANKRRLIAAILLRHIHAIDIDDRALETAKTNIWKEAIKLEKGLFNFRKLSSEFNHILPNLEDNFINADAIYDMALQNQVDWMLANAKKEVQSIIYLRKKYIARPTEPEIVEEILQIKSTLRELMEMQLSENLLSRPTLIVLEFPHLFFDEKGNPLPKNKMGFDGIISNPPWEEIYPVRKEFADIGKFEMDKADLDKEFEKRLKKDVEFKKGWEEYQERYKRYTQYVYEAYDYHQMKPESSTAMRSHLNYFKLLFERNLQLIRQGGFMNILIPSSFQTDEGSYGIRKLALEETKMLQLFSFENKGFFEEGKEKKTKIFQDVHAQFKFSIALIEKNKPNEDHSFDSLFYLTNPSELYSNTPLPYNIEMVNKFSPDNLSILEFRGKDDYTLCKKIRNNHPTLRQSGFTLKREFNVTDDRKYFDTEKKNKMSVYEGKMIHQFNSNFAGPKYFVDDNWAYNNLLEKEVGRLKEELNTKKTTKELKQEFVKNKYKIEKEYYRFGYRDVGGATNERTLISTIVPPNVYTVNTIIHVLGNKYSLNRNVLNQSVLDEKSKVYLMSLFNSFVLNYYMRNRISSHASMFIVYELPIAKVKEHIAGEIQFKSFALLYNISKREEYEELRKKLGHDKKQVDQYNNSPKLHKLRAELEVLIAKELYGLDKKDWEYLTSTFVYGEDSETKIELDEIIRMSKEIF